MMGYNANLNSSANANANASTNTNINANANTNTANLNGNANSNLDGSLVSMSNGSGYSSRPGTGTRSASASATVPVLPPAHELEIVRRLGTGSYAIVYLAREVLRRPKSSRPSWDADEDDIGLVIGGHMDCVGIEGFGNGASRRNGYSEDVVYGREFAVKCLSKANLDDQALAAQLAEVR